MTFHLVEAPIFDSVQGSIQASNYLIHEIDKHNFTLHRELDSKEVEHFIDKGIFEYKGKTYLAEVANFPTKDKALAAIHSYWQAAKTLNEIDDS